MATIAMRLRMSVCILTPFSMSTLLANDMRAVAVSDMFSLTPCPSVMLDYKVQTVVHLKVKCPVVTDERTN